MTLMLLITPRAANESLLECHVALRGATRQRGRAKMAAVLLQHNQMASDVCTIYECLR